MLHGLITTCHEVGNDGYRGSYWPKTGVRHISISTELRLFFGPGYRVYFGEHGDAIVVLLCGGDKGSQSKDIEQAKAYWKEYLGHEQL